MIKPIETKYKGYRFRSRLEARWAVCFDELGIEYEYEKEGYNLIGELNYLPDFWLPYPPDDFCEYKNSGHWVEIKHTLPEQVDLTKLLLLSIITNHNGVLLSGPPWEFQYYFTNRHGWFGGPYTPESPWGTDYAWGLNDLFNRFMSGGGTQDAIDAAKCVRFEHSERK